MRRVPFVDMGVPNWMSLALGITTGAKGSVTAWCCCCTIHPHTALALSTVGLFTLDCMWVLDGGGWSAGAARDTRSRVVYTKKGLPCQVANEIL